MYELIFTLLLGVYTLPWLLRRFSNLRSSQSCSGVDSQGKSKLAVCTGSASGIGKAATIRLLEQGWTVLATDINAEGLKSLQAEMTGEMSDRLKIFAVDIANAESRGRLVSLAKSLVESKEVAGLAALISAAGIIDSQPVATLTDERISQIFEVNALGAIKLINALCPLLIAGDGGRLTVMSSMSGRYSWPWAGAYPATKHALEGYCKTLRIEAKANKLKLKISLIQPGAVATQMALNLPEKQLQWTKANPGSWTSGLAEAVARTQRLLRFGFKIKWVAVSPERVVDKIMHSVSAPYPDENYVIGSVPMLMIFYLAISLPTPLADFLLMSM